MIRLILAAGTALAGAILLVAWVRRRQPETMGRNGAVRELLRRSADSGPQKGRVQGEDELEWLRRTRV